MSSREVKGMEAVRGAVEGVIDSGQTLWALSFKTNAPLTTGPVCKKHALHEWYDEEDHGE